MLHLKSMCFMSSIFVFTLLNHVSVAWVATLHWCPFQRPASSVKKWEGETTGKTWIGLITRGVIHANVMIRSVLDCPSTVCQTKIPKALAAPVKDMLIQSQPSFPNFQDNSLHGYPCSHALPSNANRSLKSPKSSKSGALALSAARPIRQGIGWLDEVANILGCFITFRSSIMKGGTEATRFIQRVGLQGLLECNDHRRLSTMATELMGLWVCFQVSKHHSHYCSIILRLQLGNLKRLWSERLWSKSLLFKNPKVLKVHKPRKIPKDPSLSNMFQPSLVYRSTRSEASFAENPENQEAVETASWAARETGNQAFHRNIREKMGISYGYSGMQPMKETISWWCNV